jgi:5'-deoxynucleotidase YfbR-like HD superfamily hydrolase
MLKSLPETSKTMKAIDNALNFIIEIEKLKNVHRKTRPVGLERYENSAEHSWHVCMAALALKEFSNVEIDIQKVIMMLLIHDLGEIDAGDTIIYKSETVENKKKEAEGLKRILTMLPEEKSREYIALWFEFEDGKSAESKFAKAVDRIPPLLHNLHGKGHSWQENNVSKEMVLTLNSRIGDGSEKVWEALKSQLQEAITVGILK